MRLDTHKLQEGEKVVVGDGPAGVADVVKECPLPLEEMVVVGTVPGIGVPNGKA